MTEESSYVQYAVVDDNGLILRVGTSKSIDIEYITTTPTEHVILDNVPPNNNCRWDGAKWIAIPARPVYPANFDITTNTWKDLRDLSDFKKLKWEEIKNIRTQLENNGFTWNGNIFDSDQKSQLYLTHALTLTKTTNTKIPWILKNNSIILLSEEDLIEINLKLSEFITSIYNTSQNLRNTIENATSIEELESISWPGLSS